MTKENRTRNRHANIVEQLSWMEAKGIIHSVSYPHAGVQSKFGITISEHGPRLGLTLAETEAWISGAIAMWAWFTTRYSQNEAGDYIRQEAK